MRHLKELVLAVQHMLKDNPIAETPELEKALDNAVDFLTLTKSYEYSGKIKCSGIAVKLSDANTDFDDVIKMIANKTSDIELVGDIYVVVYAEKPAEESKAAA